jgi:hypothetical protein
MSDRQDGFPSASHANSMLRPHGLGGALIWITMIPSARPQKNGDGDFSQSNGVRRSLCDFAGAPSCYCVPKHCSQRPPDMRACAQAYPKRHVRTDQAGGFFGGDQE